MASSPSLPGEVKRCRRSLSAWGNVEVAPFAAQMPGYVNVPVSGTGSKRPVSRPRLVVVELHASAVDTDAWAACGMTSVLRRRMKSGRWCALLGCVMKV